ncbi:MAG: hypothetical protein JM58_00345 [Peptococcaceae bacterium BICA1-8]|nr:MAG: hypothetical protein JM58_00345 [Peptococcaceae bacterium BICA1-8]
MCYKNIYSDFKPFQKGICKVLGKLEAEVMEIVWSEGKVSVRNVYEILVVNREIAYTTVMTTLGRLTKKGILSKTRQGNAYLYSSFISKEEFINNMISSILESLVRDYKDEVIECIDQKKIMGN